MFEHLGDRFQQVFRKVSGQHKLSEDNIKEAVREVRMALLEADVHFKVVKDFIATVSEKSVGAEVLKSVRPADMFIKLVHDEMVAMMGGSAPDYELPKGEFSVILLLGLQGSGKTTFAGKLATRFGKQGLKPYLVACDIYRPAAIEQLHVIGRQVGAPVFDMGTQHPAQEVAAAGVTKAREAGHDLVIVDTAGRLHIDEVRMDELQAIKRATAPRFSFFVADAMTGQDAVNSASHFAEHIGIDGVCLTKLDGDARGGAALSIRAVTGRPVYFAGVGERPEDLEPFHPDRMASRILGMGDVVSLVEKAQEQVSQEEAEELQKKLKRQEFDLQDFLDHMKKMKKMGPLSQIMEMIPGMKGFEIPDDAFKPMEAMILSMTPEERANPDRINGSRRKRIASGSGTDVPAVNDMLKEFAQTRRMMSQMLAMKGGPAGLMKRAMAAGGNGEAAVTMPQDGGAAAVRGARGGGMPGAKVKPKHRRKQKSKKNRKK